MDPSLIQNFFALPLDQMLKAFLINFGWMPVAAVMIWGAMELWLYYRQLMYAKTIESILLAIDIPKLNEQSVKAVENMFTYFAGAHSNFNLIDKYWDGKFQLSFSFEIVSIDGYTQFLIRTPVQFRNLVETAVYSQYPDAEITEVNDYAEGIPDRYPDDEWDIWGAEFIYVKNHAYPIKTYSEFADDLSKPDAAFKDPMATLMDLCSSLRPGEQLWYQIIVYPLGFDWMDEMEKEVAKILKEKASAKKGVLGSVWDQIFGFLGEVMNELTGGGFSFGAGEEAKVDDPLKMMQLKPKDKKRVEAIQRKTSQLGFEAKNRFIYVAKKELMNKPKVVSGFVGYMKQFMDLDLNNLKPDMDRTATSAEYFFVESTVNAKKLRLMAAYKGRSGSKGRLRKVFSIEELATLWHFPIDMAVKAPLIQKSPGRKAEAPMTLPVEDEGPGRALFIEGEKRDQGASARLPFEDAPGTPAAPEPAKEATALPWEAPVEEESAPAATEKRGSPPENLPFV